jgi:uncharacterized damage-inducible protein DinB
MTLQEIKLLQAYNSWANNRIFDAAEHLSTEQYMKDMKSSHGGIHGTLVHTVGAEKVWLERWQGATQPFLKADKIGSVAELKAIWENVGFGTAQWLSGMTNNKLSETFTMKTLKGETFTHIYWQAFQHVVNHSSYHRGQIITMMRLLDVKPPSTDLILFYREMGKLT